MPRLFTLAIATALFGASAATAAEPSYGRITRSIAVTHADLDLRTEQGARTMLRRLNAASSHACGSFPTQGAYLAVQAQTWRACRSASLAAAVTRLGSPKVSELYKGDHQPATKLARR
jgi:UrcA family protein